MTKATQIREIVAAHIKTKTRKEIAEILVAEVGVTEKAAGAYYYKAKKQLERQAAGLPLSHKAVKKKLMEGTAPAPTPARAEKKAETEAAVEVPAKEELKEKAAKFKEWREKKAAEKTTVAAEMTEEELEEELEVPEWEWSIEDQEEAKEILRVQMG